MKSLAHQLMLDVEVITEELNFIPKDNFIHKEHPYVASKKERIGYLVNQAIYFSSFLLKGRFNEETLYLDWQEEKAEEGGKYENYEQARLISIWAELNTNIAGMVENLGEEQVSSLHKVSIEGNEREVDIHLIVERYLDLLDEEIHEVLSPMKAL
ncbi:hypothetical protein [Aureibacter tunicatorum]|uniref:DinB family protein n=1 Tax=Aureibacter tunicatorum TaxID=866807 RepID=A0AAE3XND4_9BACT|nr:hypothetical protein [Aureibacter tunicatorum]MDR6239138.1 hypothetical protein [Aureibacter tunicatorum]BDD04936.1 hypothetical protein AUTU_24190 [Aureibacter tunicatorum]